MPRTVRWLTAAAVLLVTAADARAFFFKGWPGDGRAKPQSLLRLGTPDEGVQPPGEDDWPSPGDDTSLPGGGSSAIPAVPEPGALVLAAVGMGALAVAQRCRRARAR
jgi:hypothetical protein